ncbi:unnamed protein product [Acanthoscelides obtectus]|uniref:DDE Tnp4 domain-containing protein n=1 Tax=Acanthoscelides obtectus TaxID=200917 RepID=A0A9P0JWZ8_ACAOB|nr:unnamed protein product [Acanthoscelides obtectus]CAK1623782.1 hypothetical protein AOBTE_LOCUS2179 [Acanthoscelides obtectus]
MQMNFRFLELETLSCYFKILCDKKHSSSRDFVGMDKGTASRIVWKVTRAIADIKNTYIAWGKQCRIRARFERGDFNEYVIVGDSGYPIKNYLITLLANPVTKSEQLSNASQIRTKNCIERKFGQWKRRFPILTFGIRLKVKKVEHF